MKNGSQKGWWSSGLISFDDIAVLVTDDINTDLDDFVIEEAGPQYVLRWWNSPTARLGSQRGDCAVLHNHGVFLRSGEGGLDLRLFADNLRGANRVRGAGSGPGRAQFRGIRGDNRSGFRDVQI